MARHYHQTCYRALQTKQREEDKMTPLSDNDLEEILSDATNNCNGANVGDTIRLVEEIIRLRAAMMNKNTSSNIPHPHCTP